MVLRIVIKRREGTLIEFLSHIEVIDENFQDFVSLSSLFQKLSHFAHFNIGSHQLLWAFRLTTF